MTWQPVVTVCDPAGVSLQLPPSMLPPVAEGVISNTASSIVSPVIRPILCRSSP